AAAQHDRREGAAHAGELRVALALAKDPAVERTDDGRRSAAHLHGLGQVAKAVEEAAHRGLGGDAAALAAADAVGARGDDVAARFRQFPAEDGAAEILVTLARSGLGGEPDACLDAGNPLSHRPSDAVLLRISIPRSLASVFHAAAVEQHAAAGRGRQNYRK